MGKKRNRKNKGANTIQPEVSTNIYTDRTMSKIQPIIIPMDTFQAISEYMLQLAAPHRNVFLSVNEYAMNEINPTLIQTKDSPTHMIVFCLRLIMTDHFNPLGVVQINKRVDQTDKLVTVWKAFIQDLSILRLFVIGSISPASPIFHDVLSKLTENPNLENHTGPITYSVWPYDEILHIYDYYYLMQEFQDALYEHVDLSFISRPPSEQTSDLSPTNLKLYTACWTDILLTIASDGIDCIYTTEEAMASNLSIFSQYFKSSYERISEKGLIVTDTKQSTDRLMQLLWAYAEIAHVNIDLSADDLKVFYEEHEDLRILLASAQFRWLEDYAEITSVPTADKISIPFVADSNKYVTDQISANSKQVVKFVNSTEDGTVLPTNQSEIAIKCSTNFEDDTGSSIELGDNQMKTIMDVINDSLDTDCDISCREPTPFDSFVQKFIYGDYDLFAKMSPTEDQETDFMRADIIVAHDHDYSKKDTSEGLPATAPKESSIAKLVKEYFEEFKLCQAAENIEADYQSGNESRDIFKKHLELHKTTQCEPHNSVHDQQIPPKVVVETKSAEFPPIPNFSGPRYFFPSNMHNVYGRCDSREIRRFQQEMQLLTMKCDEYTNFDESCTICANSKSRKTSKKSKNSTKRNVSPPPPDDCMIIPYDTPKMPQHNCDNCDNEQCKQENSEKTVQTSTNSVLELSHNLCKHTPITHLKLSDATPVLLGDKSKHVSALNRDQIHTNSDSSENITLPVIPPVKVLKTKNSKQSHENKDPGKSTPVISSKISDTAMAVLPENVYDDLKISFKSQVITSSAFPKTETLKSPNCDQNDDNNGSIVGLIPELMISSIVSQTQALNNQNYDSKNSKTTLTPQINTSPMVSQTKAAVGNGSQQTHVNNRLIASPNISPAKGFTSRNSGLLLRPTSLKERSGSSIDVSLSANKPVGELSSVTLGALSNTPKVIKCINQNQNVISPPKVLSNKTPKTEVSTNKVSDNTLPVEEIEFPVNITDTSFNGEKNSSNLNKDSEPMHDTKSGISRDLHLSEVLSLNNLHSCEDEGNRNSNSASRIPETSAGDESVLNIHALTNDPMRPRIRIRDDIFINDKKGNANTSDTKESEAVIIDSEYCIKSASEKESCSMKAQLPLTDVDFANPLSKARNIYNLKMNGLKATNSLDNINIMKMNGLNIANSLKTSEKIIKIKKSSKRLNRGVPGVPSLVGAGVSDFGGSYNRTLDGLDLANNEGDIYETVVTSLLDIPSQNFPDILEYPLVAAKCNDDTINIPARSDSLDSLAELVSALDEEAEVTRFPSKYTIPKKIGIFDNLNLNIREDNVIKVPQSATSYTAVLNPDKLVKQSAKENKKSRRRLKSSSSAAVLLSKENLNYTLALFKLQKNYELYKKHKHFVNRELKSKLPVEELETLIEKVHREQSSSNNFNQHSKDSVIYSKINRNKADENSSKEINGERDVVNDHPTLSEGNDKKPEKCLTLNCTYKELFLSETDGIYGSPSKNKSEDDCKGIAVDRFKESEKFYHFNSKNGDETWLSPCCSLPSTSSDFHDPSGEIREPVSSLPHYTRFDISLSRSSSGESIFATVENTVVPSASNEPVIETVPDCESEPIPEHEPEFISKCEPETTDNNNKKTDEMNEIDYREYRKTLLSTLCDKKKHNCDITFKDKDNVNKLFSLIPEDFESLRVTTDWLCTLKGYAKLKEILVRRKVRFIRSKLLCVEHICFYVSIIKKLKNHLLSTVYEGSHYKFLDYRCAFDLLVSGQGVYILKQDEENVKSL